MYFGVAKVIFDVDRGTGSELKDAKALCEKLASRLKVCAKTCLNSSGGFSAIAVAALARTEDDINGLLDKVLEICEAADLGRIESEYSVVEHIDVLEEEDGDENGESDED